jgi:hypothetical protein
MLSQERFCLEKVNEGFSKIYWYLVLYAAFNLRNATWCLLGVAVLIIEFVSVGSEIDGEPTEVGEEEDLMEDFSLEDQR